MVKAGIRRQGATICLLAALLMQSRAALSEAPGAYAITNARIVTGTGKIIEKGSVVFRDGLITDVGQDVKIPADARVIDGTGLTVYPGLLDAYSNLGVQQAAPSQPERPGAQQPTPAAAQAGQQPERVHGDPSISAADQVTPNMSGLGDARSVGITTALISPRQGILAGQSALINLMGSEAAKMVVRAPVALTVQFTTGGGFGGGGGIYPGSLMGTVAFIRQTFYDAIHYRDQIERYERVKRGVPRPDYNKKLAALLPALSGQVPVMFIANSEGDIRRALAIADEFKLKPIIVGALEGYRLLDLLKQKNVPVILSVDFPRRPADLPEDEDEPLRVLRHRAEAPKGAARLAQAGIKFAFTSGSLRPQDFIANIEKAVQNGLPKEEAIKALTINAAEILGAADQLGSVEVGKIANLVVTAGDLLARDTKIKYLFIDGQQVQLRPSEQAPARRPAAANAVDPSGEWDLSVNSPQGEIKIRLSLRREAGGFSGTIAGPTGTENLQTVTLNGNQLRCTASINFGGQAVEVVLAGTLEGNSMRGTITVSGLGSFDFTGSRPQ
jgi:imidazolonepropionase-like amidohydrolase